MKNVFRVRSARMGAPSKVVARLRGDQACRPMPHAPGKRAGPGTVEAMKLEATRAHQGAGGGDRFWPRLCECVAGSPIARTEIARERPIPEADLWVRRKIGRPMRVSTPPWPVAQVSPVALWPRSACTAHKGGIMFSKRSMARPCPVVSVAGSAGSKTVTAVRGAMPVTSWDTP